ncbi:Aldehyde dehydrogenase [Geranomyces variabilis]|nr:Aldehyde dehydrogenase [Geranomyces variabilis]
MADADLDLAAESLIASLTVNNGQYCCGAGRVLVHADVKDAFLDAVGRKMALVKIGLPTDKATQMGPLCVALAKPLLAQSFTTTPIPDVLSAGHFVPPTLILDAPVTSDELFGPVATLHMFTTVDEVVSMTHAARSRLKGYIYGKDAAAVHAIQERIICAWWDCNVFRMGNPGVKSVGFAGLSGCGDGTPDMFLQSRYIGVPE